MLQLFLLTAVLLHCATAIEWFISPTGRVNASGSETDPFPSIPIAFQRAAFKADDIFTLENGVYTDSFRLRLNSVPVTIRARNAGNATINTGRDSARIDCAGSATKQSSLMLTGLLFYSGRPIINCTMCDAALTNVQFIAVDLSSELVRFVSRFCPCLHSMLGSCAVFPLSHALHSRICSRFAAARGSSYVPFLECRGAATVCTLTRCLFTANVLADGGVFVRSWGAGVRVLQSTFEENSLNDPHPNRYVQAVLVLAGRGDFEQSAFRGNQFPFVSAMLGASVLRLSDLTVTDNSLATSWVGMSPGVWVDALDGGLDFRAERCVFADNSQSAGEAGAIAVGLSAGAKNSVQIAQCEFARNAIDTVFGEQGGAVMISDWYVPTGSVTSVKLTSNKFLLNSAPEQGGALTLNLRRGQVSAARTCLYSSQKYSVALFISVWSRPL